MELSNKEYFVVFDTNILHQQYDKKANYTAFSFNSQETGSHWIWN